MHGEQIARLAIIVAIGAVLNSSIRHETWATEPKNIVNSIGMKLIEIPAGEFMMGAEEDRAETLNIFPYYDPVCLDSELPRHRVRITKSFYMGQFEVTVGQFQKFSNEMRYKFEEDRTGIPSWSNENNRLAGTSRFQTSSPGKTELDHPVVFATWNNAVAFCEWLSKKEGKKYRLPTEAEWEYACRAGTRSRYYFGNDPEELFRFANAAGAESQSRSPSTAVLPTFDANGMRTNQFVSFPFLTQPDGYSLTAPVGQFRPNAFGLYDMHGNATEMCSDWYDENYYKNSPRNDPQGPSNGFSCVFRGGGCGTTPASTRCAARFAYPPAHRHKLGGFRVVRDR
jgi:formylglycine-generating enzyme required for sulfatase activity